MRRISLFVNNLLIFISCIWSTILFWALLPFNNLVQQRIFKRLIKKNKNTDYLSRVSSLNKKLPDAIPLSHWDVYQKYVEDILKGKSGGLTREKVLLLEPTSGTSSATKYIPYTRELQKEFNRAIQPWIAGLYLRWPGLLAASQYWSVSPEVKKNQNKSSNQVPIAFAQDSQYLGSSRSSIFEKILTVPQSIKNCIHSENWLYLTAWYLLRDQHLGLISIWHPSFLCIIIEKILSNYQNLTDDIETGKIRFPAKIAETCDASLLPPMPSRARQLRKTDINEKGAFNKIWPKLKVISCWADQPTDSSLPGIKEYFPGVFIQPKGIVATEGIFSFPFGKIPGLLAFRSHYIEFIDVETAKLKTLKELEKGKLYETVITNGGGLYRYRMNDLVKVKSMILRKLPQLEFLHKRDYVSDIRGEKISLEQVIEIEKKIRTENSDITFFMLAPAIIGKKAFYACFMLATHQKRIMPSAIARTLDDALSANFHYQYAREIGQLQKPAVFLLKQEPTQYITNHLEQKGIKKGDIKIYPLSKTVNWQNILQTIQSCHI